MRIADAVAQYSESTRRVRGCAAVQVSIVSSSQLLRQGLAALLQDHLDLNMVGSYAADQDLREPMPAPPDHVVVLDGSIGLEAIRRWTRHWRSTSPAARVLAVELADDTELILDCVAAGVAAYTIRGASAAEVAEAISGVRGNRAQCDPRVTAGLFARLAALADQATPELLPAWPSLTPRELEVLHHLSQDRTNKEIAARMVIEVRTVKHHVHSILQKLKLRHRWDAVRLARERGWLDVDPRSMR